jgi:hypothetical protein
VARPEVTISGQNKEGPLEGPWHALVFPDIRRHVAVYGAQMARISAPK